MTVIKIYPLSYKAKDYEMENPYYRIATASLNKDIYDQYIMRYGKDVYYAWRNF